MSRALLTATFVTALLAVSGVQAATEPVGVKVPTHQRFVLSNGLTIILVPKKEVPMIAFSGFVRGGALADPAGKDGVASLVAGAPASAPRTNSPMQWKAWAAASTRPRVPRPFRSAASSWRATAR
jgi:hypothetical protein